MRFSLFLKVLMLVYIFFSNKISNTDQQDVFGSSSLFNITHEVDNEEIPIEPKHERLFNDYRSSLQLNMDKVLCYFAHNYLRFLHGVPPFKWHNQLGEGARDWALHLAAEEVGSIRFSPDSSFYTENIQIFHGGDKNLGVLEAVQSWYEEIRNYDFSSHVIDPEKNYYSLMFAKIVWDDESRLGCGVARNEKSGDIFVVARYAPSKFTMDPELFREHIKPPLKYIFNTTINSKNIYVPAIKDFLTFVPGSLHPNIQIAKPDQWWVQAANQPVDFEASYDQDHNRITSY